MWKPIDWFADWVGETLNYRWQKRIAAICFFSSFGFLIYMPFSKEPPAIFLMSFLALVFSAISIIAAVEAAEVADENT